MQKIIFFRPSQLAQTKNGNELLLLLRNSQVVDKESQISPFVWHWAYIFILFLRCNSPCTTHLMGWKHGKRKNDFDLLKPVRKADGFELR